MDSVFRQKTAGYGGYFASTIAHDLYDYSGLGFFRRYDRTFECLNRLEPSFLNRGWRPDAGNPYRDHLAIDRFFGTNIGMKSGGIPIAYGMLPSPSSLFSIANRVSSMSRQMFFAKALDAKTIANKFLSVNTSWQAGEKALSQADAIFKGGIFNTPSAITPYNFFGNKTYADLQNILMSKFGPPHTGAPGGLSFFNSRTGRTFHLHQQPGHMSGKPHVDIRRRGPYEERKFLLKEEE
jgi:hypothetical protein